MPTPPKFNQAMFQLALNSNLETIVHVGIAFSASFSMVISGKLLLQDGNYCVIPSCELPGIGMIVFKLDAVANVIMQGEFPKILLTPYSVST